MEKIIRSLSDYTNWVNEYYKKQGEDRKHHFFRGLSSDKYNLLPSVLRDDQLNEKEVILDFKQFSYPKYSNFSFIDDLDKILVDMRHYELPTRLIDWSLAPLTSLFFACKYKPEENGKIFILNPWRLWEKLVNNKNTPEIHQIHIISRALLGKGWDFGTIKKFIGEKYFFNDLSEESLVLPFPYISVFSNERISSQKGCFTIQGSNKNELETTLSGLEVLHSVIIDKSCKDQITQELNNFFINDFSFYPDTVGMKYVFDKYKSLFNRF
ncbi:FRG domain-containing protein [Cognataquiflexum aquatile]|uniref:FRG domain-containing protein n=1 Tax=Cognataquiflexum aquatile TaxID=2249427 RepID=UPI000DEBDCF0|nr:FRG domain-containing protein [Cognataquiflexum aquatile]